ncbi:hypothetical protein HYQ44_013836 [Verticillium longisporum]|nr:hypothetical protein HYQ44_013836 [Verticillium longisporum]
MQGNRKHIESEFLIQAKRLEAEEVLAKILGKVSADELLAAVVESAHAILAGLLAERRTQQVHNLARGTQAGPRPPLLDGQVLIFDQRCIAVRV